VRVMPTLAPLVAGGVRLRITAGLTDDLLDFLLRVAGAQAGVRPSILDEAHRTERGHQQHHSGHP